MMENEARLKAHELLMKFGPTGAVDLALWECHTAYQGDEEEDQFEYWSAVYRICKAKEEQANAARGVEVAKPGPAPTT